MLLHSPVNSIHRDMTQAYFDNRLQSQDFPWEIDILYLIMDILPARATCWWQREQRQNYFLGNSIYYIYMDNQIHGSTCVKRYFLSPLEDIHAYFKLTSPWLSCNSASMKGAHHTKFKLKKTKKLFILTTLFEHFYHLFIIFILIVQVRFITSSHTSEILLV